MVLLPSDIRNQKLTHPSRTRPVFTKLGRSMVLPLRAQAINMGPFIKEKFCFKGNLTPNITYWLVHHTLSNLNGGSVEHDVSFVFLALEKR